MKRFLSLLLCALLLAGALPLSAGAESGAVVMEAPASCVPEEQFTVCLGVTGLKKCCGLSLCLEYDSSVLTLEEATPSTGCPNAQVNAGEPGVIRFTFASGTLVTLPETVLYVSFRANSAAGGSSAALRVTEAAASDEDQNTLSLSLPAGATVSVAKAQPVSLVLLSETETDGSVTVRVLLAKGSSFCGLRFLLGYENCAMDSCSGRKDSALNGNGSSLINPNYSADRIFFSHASIDACNLSGELLRARFTPGGGEAPVFFIDGLRAYGANSAALETAWSRDADAVITSAWESGTLRLACAASSETETVVACAYDAGGRMLTCAFAGQEPAPRSPRSIDFDLPASEDDAVVKVFFLGENGAPRRAPVLIFAE